VECTVYCAQYFIVHCRVESDVVVFV